MRLRQLSIALALALSATEAGALGFGEIEVRSRLNEPLDAWIRIASADEEELATLSVRLATAEDYSRMGLRQRAVPVAVEFSVERDRQGRPAIRVRSRQPVREPLLPLLVEAQWSKGRMFREFVVLLDPPLTVPAVAKAPAVRPARVEDQPAPAPPRESPPVLKKPRRRRNRPLCARPRRAGRACAPRSSARETGRRTRRRRIPYARLRRRRVWSGGFGGDALADRARHPAGGGRCPADAGGDFRRQPGSVHRRQCESVAPRCGFAHPRGGGGQGHRSRRGAAAPGRAQRGLARASWGGRARADRGTARAAAGARCARGARGTTARGSSPPRGSLGDPAPGWGGDAVADGRRWRCAGPRCGGGGFARRPAAQP